MDLKSITLYEELFFGEDKNLYARVKETGEKRLINEQGCEILIEHEYKNKSNEERIKSLREEIIRLQAETKENQIIIGKLYEFGFCNMDHKEPVRDDTTLQIIGETKTHMRYCRNSVRRKK